MKQNRYEKIIVNTKIIIFIIVFTVFSYYISLEVNTSNKILNKQYNDKSYFLSKNKISNNLVKFKKEFSFYEKEFKKLRSTSPYNWNNYNYYNCNYFNPGINTFSNNIFIGHIKNCHESFIDKIDEFNNKFIIFNFTNIKNLSKYKLQNYDSIFNYNKYLLFITDNFIANGIVNYPIDLQIISNNLYENNKIGLPLNINGFFEIYYIKGIFKGCVYNGEIRNGLANGIGSFETIDGIFISTTWNEGYLSNDGISYRSNGNFNFMLVHNYRNGYKKYYFNDRNFDDNKANISNIINIFRNY